MTILTEKEKQKIEDLKIGFNIVKENKDINYMSSRRVDISRVWSKRLLVTATFINILSIILMLIAFFIEYKKPDPEFFATTPTGKIYHLQNLHIR